MSAQHEAIRASPGPLTLEPVQRLATTGARAVEPFSDDGELYLAVPQLSEDVAGQTWAMTGGNSDVDTLVYRWRDGCFVPHQRLALPGGEDAEFFVIGERRFLAVASLRSGQGPYRMDVDSVIYEIDGDRFLPFQRIAGHAAKQWRHFSIDGRHFLALAQGASHDLANAPQAHRSYIYEWRGDAFAPLQSIESAWGYNWTFFESAGDHYLAYADHVAPSCVLRWNGARFVPDQTFPGSTGRAFCHFEAGGAAWLAFARLADTSLLYRIDRGTLVEPQVLGGTGGREFAWLPDGGGGHLIRINFIRGSREAPEPRLLSQVYAFAGGALAVESEFETTGATDAAFFSAGGASFLAVSQAVGDPPSFSVATLIYRIGSS